MLNKIKPRPSSSKDYQMVKHNNQLVNNHFRKNWDRRVRTWFNQPGRKLRRQQNRQKKAALVYPKPVSGSLRPLVRCPTQRYNMKVRLGRGFTLGELKAANVNVHEARGLGITVDYRREDRNRETQNANVQRLKLYRSKQVVFPRKVKKVKGQKGVKPEKKEDLAAVVQQTKPFPFVVRPAHESSRAITPAMKSSSAWKTIRSARAKANRAGEAAKKAAAAANIVGAETK